MSIKPRKVLESLKPYIPGKSVESVVKEYGLTNVIKMASNENPLGCPISADELKRCVENASHYPDISTSDLPQKLAIHLGLDRSNILLGNGSDDLLQMIALAFLNPGDEVLIQEHTFSNYTFVAKLMDAEIKIIPMTDYEPDLDQMLKSVTPRTKVIFLANPNNPTGAIVLREPLESFLSNLSQDCIVVLDEAYIEFATHLDTPKSHYLIKKYPNLIGLRTFSKMYGLAGFRIGYAISNPENIQNLAKVRQPFTVNSIALQAAEMALEKQHFVEQTKTIVQNGKQYLENELSQLGLQVIPTEANFVCFFVQKDAKYYFQELLKKGLIIRPLNSFGMPNAIRVTIGLSEQNQRFIKTLKELF